MTLIDPVTGGPHTYHTTKQSNFWVDLLKSTAITALLSVSLASQAQRVPKVDFPPMPQIQLPVEKAQGNDAITLLGEKLPEVARAHGVEESVLDKALDLRAIARGNSGA